MTAVAASPAAVRALGAVLEDASALYRRSGAELRAAIERFAATNSEFGPVSSEVPDLLEREAQRTFAMSEQLAAFVEALQAADAAGAALTIGRPLRTADRDVVLVDSVALASVAPLHPGATIRDLIAEAEADLHHHDRLEPPRQAYVDVVRRWRSERAHLVALLRQYRAIVEPPHGGRWATVGERWISALDFRDAVEQASAELATRFLSDADGPVGPRARSISAPLVDAVGRDRPFLRSALEHGALLTPQRLAIVDDLDHLATMPLGEFISARSAATTERPWFDWTADGCSGPIPAGAQETCLRHDFLYRNARMLRDQWGLAADFALEIKDVADGRFGDELYRSYSRLELTLDPLLVAWIEAAELAVGRFGDVSEPWNPPPPGRFYGTAEPSR